MNLFTLIQILHSHCWFACRVNGTPDFIRFFYQFAGSRSIVIFLVSYFIKNVFFSIRIIPFRFLFRLVISNLCFFFFVISNRFKLRRKIIESINNNNNKVKLVSLLFVLRFLAPRRAPSSPSRNYNLTRSKTFLYLVRSEIAFSGFYVQLTYSYY